MIDVNKGIFRNKILFIYCVAVGVSLLLYLALWVGAMLMIIMQTHVMSFWKVLGFFYNLLLPLISIVAVASVPVLPVALLGLVRAFRLRSVVLGCQYFLLSLSACFLLWIGLIVVADYFR